MERLPALALDSIDGISDQWTSGTVNAAAVNEKRLGPKHPYVGINLNNLARVLRVRNRFDEAEDVFERSIAILGKAGPKHARAFNAALVDFAYLYQFQNRLTDAERIYREALVIAERRGKEDPTQLANNLNNLAQVLRRLDRFDETEALYRRAVSLLEGRLGPDHPRLVVALNNLARLYWWQNRFEDADAVYARALDIARRKMPPDSTRRAVVLHNYSEVFSATERHAEAERMAVRALAIREDKLGRVDYRTGQTLNRLGEIYRDQERYGEARDMFRRGLRVWEEVLGPDHFEVALVLTNLGRASVVLGDHEEAARYYRRAGDIRLASFGADHPLLAESRTALARTLTGIGRYGEAMDHIRQGVDTVRGQVNRLLTRRQSGDVRSGARLRDVATTFVAVADAIAGGRPDGELLGETFETAQLVHATSTATALANMAARFGSGADRLAELVRRRQDKLGELGRLDQHLLEGLARESGRRNPQAETDLRRRMTALSAELKGLDETLTDDFPAYAELSSPAPVSLADVQSLLDAKEALLVYLVADNETYLWVVRHDRAAFHRIVISADDLEDVVAELRIGLDPSTVARLEEMPAFDVGLAHRFYKTILAPAEPLLEDAEHVMLVKDRALYAMAFGTLVREPPTPGLVGVDLYRNTSWLASRFATTVLPSVSSLRALRRFAREAGSEQPFIGIGEPKLEGPAGRTRRVSFASIYRRKKATVDLAALRNLPPLPETAVELRSMADTLGSPLDSVILREQATETNVKKLNLSDVRIVAFATHAAIAGELSGVAEPALVLTPPERASPLDDGLLTSSEVAQLKMNADWVVLSACNTAAGDGSPDAAGLSGLAKSFFYAGSRALLVSHWPVVSDAAAKLTSRAFWELSLDPTLGRSEAVRRAGLAVMSDVDNPRYAHPVYWAPFFVVGEGDIDRTQDYAVREPGEN